MKCRNPNCMALLSCVISDNAKIKWGFSISVKHFGANTTAKSEFHYPRQALLSLVSFYVCVYVCMYLLIYSSPKDIFSLLLQRGKEREEGRETLRRERSMVGLPPVPAQTGDCICPVGLCSDWNQTRNLSVT